MATAETRPQTNVGGNLALLVISIGLAVLASELVARMMLPAPLPWRFPQLGYRADPDLIFSLVPNQHAFSADKPIVINERGLRGPVVPYARTAGKQRLLFLGDSIVFGYGVRDGEAVDVRVGSLLTATGLPTETVNSGVPAYNTRQEIAFLERDGMKYGSDWVILGVCWNDLGDKTDVAIDAEGRLVSRRAAAEHAAAPVKESAWHYEVRDLLKRSRLLYGAREAWRRLTTSRASDDQTTFRTAVLEGRATPKIDDGWQDIGLQLHRLHELAARGGFKPLVVAFPIPIAIAQSYPNSSYPARLQELAAAEGLPFLDLAEPFRRAYHGHESLFIPYDGDHPNAAGHDIAAREIARVIAPTMVKAAN